MAAWESAGRSRDTHGLCSFFDLNEIPNEKEQLTFGDEIALAMSSSD
jgi:hypothetical protein